MREEVGRDPYLAWAMWVALEALLEPLLTSWALGQPDNQRKTLCGQMRSVTGAIKPAPTQQDPAPCTILIRTILIHVVRSWGICNGGHVVVILAR